MAFYLVDLNFECMYNTKTSLQFLTKKQTSIQYRNKNIY